MMVRELGIVVVWLWMTPWVMGVTYPPLTSYREDDGHFYFHKYRPEIFYDNKVLPEQIEVDIFVYKDQVKRVFFLVEKEASPVELIVTPCSAPVEWRLLLRRYPSTSGQDEHEPWHNQVPNDGDADNPVILMTYTGSERRTFYRGKSATGLYVLELDSRDQDTNAKVFLRTGHSTKSLSPYPELPDGAKVKVVRARRVSVFLTWEPSYSREVRYCVAINRVRSLRSVCSVRGLVDGESPPTPPPSAGFGFWWEKMVRKKLEGSPGGSKVNLTMECVGKKTWYKVRNLRQSQKYFFDVFAIDAKSNLSTAYKGASAFTKSPAADRRLKSNAMTPLSLNRNNSFATWMDFHVSSPASSVLWLFVQSCSGPGPVRVTVAGSQSSVLLDTLVMDFKTLSIGGLRNGTYTLAVRSEVPSHRRVNVWFSRKRNRYPFPALPDDKKIQVFETLTKCMSVTLSWKTTSDEKVKYCLYRKEANDSVPEASNRCRAPSSEGKVRVLCKRYHRFSRHRFSNVVIQKVTGLQPDTTYVFDLHVTKCRGKTLAYDPVWVRTSNKECSSESTNR